MDQAPTAAPLRLGVNIDHVATLRNARGGRHPDPVRAALIAIDAGAALLFDRATGKRIEPSATHAVKGEPA